ncbi:DUF1330 domain-containing protein [Sphingorhabdus lutea]|uniref:DUF1330 domain-containing protein n=1 Tax=Sphingorhabdus lutea TaxID=1913578 RepID=A0A1L3JBX5_9SPHN|nr:DUF1330 domain-containing protein [Sphingorhabdus lutea]APG62626.1 DUF1330 domain-containing protein [Sphingorhabdus lutea]
MEGKNYLDPEREAFEIFKSLPRDTSIHMLNLVKFKDNATYPADHECADLSWSGKRAYEEYGKSSGPIFASVGGTIIWRGQMDVMLIGPPNQHWDTCFIAQYPNSAAFLEMVTNEEYRKVVVHRQSAVLTSRLIRFSP